MSKPTVDEQIAAVAKLREFARAAHRLNTISKHTAEAIDTLDNANLFTDLDQERNAQEATRDRIRRELVEFANARHVALEPDDIRFVQGEPEIDSMPADQWLEAMTEERPEITG